MSTAMDHVNEVVRFHGTHDGLVPLILHLVRLVAEQGKFWEEAGNDIVQQRRKTRAHLEKRIAT